MYMTPGEREEYALPRIGKLVGNRFKRDSFKFMRDINFIMNGVRKLSGNYSPDVNTFIKVIKQYATVFHNVTDPNSLLRFHAIAETGGRSGKTLTKWYLIIFQIVQGAPEISV